MGLFRTKHVTRVEQINAQWWTFYCSCRRVYGHGKSRAEAQRKASGHESTHNR